MAAAARSCLYAGFVSVPESEWTNEIKAAAEKGVTLGLHRRPPWAVGASAAIGASAASGLVDEDALVDPSETYKPLGKGRSACASRPRACANCTCGRKEAEEAAAKEAFKKELENGLVRSSCGNVSALGWLPAFRPGEKVDLSSEARGGAAAAVAAAAAAAVAAAAQPAADAAAAGVTVAKGSNKVLLTSLEDDI
ncbi:hypothetical protein, conserved [Eimeria necatrix]|uniref:Uncharacterized protein n=1 Tax=Eimeria necatrix TaxID=51315 RepID=U6MGZ4_9EIME|nr:hypothetical protein, conserved [Eimeria necatrix]CDJ62333.1 hypothetical protein, conserved [Eimeria necatrix]